jgi:hypothetical protein
LTNDGPLAESNDTPTDGARPLAPRLRTAVSQGETLEFTEDEV